MDLRFLVQLGIIGLTFFMLINASALLVLAERKIMGFMQQRYGPYLVGPHGMLQPLADIVKLLFKEVMPEVKAHADKLGLKDPWEASAPVHLRYSTDLQAARRAAAEVKLAERKTAALEPA